LIFRHYCPATITPCRFLRCRQMPPHYFISATPSSIVHCHCHYPLLSLISPARDASTPLFCSCFDLMPYYCHATVTPPPSHRPVSACPSPSIFTCSSFSSFLFFLISSSFFRLILLLPRRRTQRFRLRARSDGEHEGLKPPRDGAAFSAASAAARCAIGCCRERRARERFTTCFQEAARYAIRVRRCPRTRAEQRRRRRRRRSAFDALFEHRRRQRTSAFLSGPDAASAPRRFMPHAPDARVLMFARSVIVRPERFEQERCRDKAQHKIC